MTLLYVDLAGPMASDSADGSHYVIMNVDDFSRFKLSKFLKTKSSVETAAVLASYVAIYITLEKVSIRAVRIDYGGEFEGEFQQTLYQLGIRHQHTPPDMPKCNDVAKEWIGLLPKKTVALLDDLKKLAAGLRKDRYCAEAWYYSTDVTSMCATTLTQTPLRRIKCMVQQVAAAEPAALFGTVGNLRRIKREHKMGPGGETCLTMGLAQNHPSSISRVLNVNIRHNVSWHLETSQFRGDADPTAAFRGSSTIGKEMPQPSLRS